MSQIRGCAEMVKDQVTVVGLEVTVELGVVVVVIGEERRHRSLSDV